MKKVTQLLLIIILAVVIIGFFVYRKGEFKQTNNNISGPDILTANEEFFEWDENNYISALTEEGAKQKEIVIPARCEGFVGPVFVDAESLAKKISFESDKDINLNGAFTCLETVEYVKLPAGLTEISSMDFWFCKALKELTVPAGVKVIDGYAFQSATSLKKVVFLSETLKIEEYAFDECVSLENIEFPSGTTEIGRFAFNNCTSLKQVTLPKGLKVLGEFAFAFSGVTDVTVDPNVEFTSVDTTAFSTTDRTITIKVIKDSWADENFFEIFAYCCEKAYYNV